MNETNNMKMQNKCWSDYLGILLQVKVDCVCFCEPQKYEVLFTLWNTQRVSMGRELAFFFRKWLDLKQTGTLKMVLLLDASTITERSLLKVFCLSEYLLNVYIYIYILYIRT